MCRGVFEGRYPALVKAAVESWETLGMGVPCRDGERSGN